MVLPRFHSLLTRRRRRRDTGNYGEYLAARFLRRHGYRVLGQNLRTRFGEVDLVALSPDRGTLVIVEVKTAREPDILPELRVDFEKQRRLISLSLPVARMCRREHLPLRFDIVGVNLPANNKISIRHHPGAFAAN